MGKLVGGRGAAFASVLLARAKVGRHSLFASNHLPQSKAQAPPYAIDATPLPTDKYPLP